jgi:ATP-dependent DNA helicase DinG
MARKLNAEKIVAALQEGGSVAARLAAYEPRQAQLGLMELIIQAFNDDAAAAAEAGTCVGKSFAYLLPALAFALENKERIVISTATITLQQQLFEKDIPLVAAALGTGRAVKAALVKGRGNYLCRRRLADALREPDLDDGGREEIEALVQWAESSKTGSRSDLPGGGLDDTLRGFSADSLWPRVCSDADLCMAGGCPERERCFVMAVRKEAADAGIIVVNHHLLFADLAARRDGAGYDGMAVLPSYTRLIIDEAHNIEAAATSFFSKEFGKPGIFRLLARLCRKRRANRQGLLVRLCALLPGADGEELLDAGVSAIDAVRAAVEELEAPALELCGMAGAFRFSPYREDDGPGAAVFPAMETLKARLASLCAITRKLLEKTGEEDQGETPVLEREIRSILRRLEAAAEICAAFPGYRERRNEVLWIERRRGANGDPWAAFTQAPAELAETLRDSLFAPHKTVICVSATLTVNNDFGYWAARSGFGLVQGRQILTGIFSSPFPYSSAVLLAVPADAPLPDESGYQDFVGKAAGRLAALSGGSALILFTSYQSLRAAWLAALPELQPLGIRCMKQGDEDRSALLRAFLEDETSVLFATDSFWEGVDAPGDTLRLVILCRLPFRSPGDPVFEARREQLEKRGGNAFMELSLPDAVMKFKQGFGRLMRRSSDRGVVAVLDGRLIKKRYGELFRCSLPGTRTCFGDFEDIARETENFLYS